MRNKLYATEKLEILQPSASPINRGFKILEPFDTIEDTKHYNQKFNLFLTDKFELHSRPLDKDGKMYLFNNYGFYTAKESLFNNNEIFQNKNTLLKSYLIFKFKKLEDWESINNKRLNLLNRLNSN